MSASAIRRAAIMTSGQREGYGCVSNRIATRRTGLNGLRMNRAFVALNRNIVLSLPTTINVCNQHTQREYNNYVAI